MLEYTAAHGPTKAWGELRGRRFSSQDWRRKAKKPASGEGPSPKHIEAARDRETLEEWHKHRGQIP